MSRLPSVPCCADEPPPAIANRRIYLPAFVVFHAHAPRGRALLLLLVQFSNANRTGASATVRASWAESRSTRFKLEPKALFRLMLEISI